MKQATCLLRWKRFFKWRILMNEWQWGKAHYPWTCIKNNKNNFGFDDSSRAFTLNTIAWLNRWLVPDVLDKKGPPLPSVRHVVVSNHLIQMNLWAQNFAAGLQEPVNMTWFGIKNHMTFIHFLSALTPPCPWPHDDITTPLKDHDMKTHANLQKVKWTHWTVCCSSTDKTLFFDASWFIQ